MLEFMYSTYFGNRGIVAHGGAYFLFISALRAFAQNGVGIPENRRDLQCAAQAGNYLHNTRSENPPSNRTVRSGATGKAIFRGIFAIRCRKL